MNRPIDPAPKTQRSAPPMRSDYAGFVPITTRWSDNDIYGHINNAVVYFYFDTAVNQLLINSGALISIMARLSVWWWKRAALITRPWPFPIH